MTCHKMSPLDEVLTSFSCLIRTVSFPDGNEHKEVPIPEQFIHKISKGSLTSEVSDLYH